MSKIIYPFAAIPNQVLRGGHGIKNIAILAVLMSHGRSTASLQTLADEAGCKRETVQKAIEYWVERGKPFGIELKITEQNRKPYIIEIDVTRCEEQTVGLVITKNNRKRILAKLYEEQNGRCYYCHENCLALYEGPPAFRSGGTITEKEHREKYRIFQMEHMIPLSKGGLDTTANVVGACNLCNMEKGTMTDSEYVSSYPQKGISDEEHLPPKGDELTPKRGIELTPKRGTEEEYLKKNQEEDRGVAIASPTPKQESEMFFTDQERQAEVANLLASRGVPPEAAKAEIAKFVGYWTEPNSTGTKQRWQLQKTFEVKRRLVTWMQRAVSRPAYRQESKTVKI